MPKGVELTLAELRAVLASRGLPSLWSPRELRVVRKIPRLGTGRVNHRELPRLLAEPAPPAPPLR